ncbi:hypothetical protein [Psychrobacter sp. BI730]|uniref:hypothetical protein n=1 Tax=Psychrobacter sp. BI730 TaxID=2705463 RepID=UPI0015CC2A8C|nr:hypothetical protein [Psychrobacter sp. BI730]NYR09564.1 hypothetical protein [Psychrobacter sp. BI730]
MSNLQPLNWVDNVATAAGRSYTIHKTVSGEYYTRIYNMMTQSSSDSAMYDTLEGVKHFAEFEHYIPKTTAEFLKPDSITDIANWFKTAKPEPTIDDLCVQIGCCLEEVCELLKALGLKDYDAHEQLTIDADAFKNKSRWVLNKLIKLSYEQRIAIVDACCDINVTSVGVMQLLGGVDVLGAQREVIRSNNSKMVNGKFEFDANGKIMKPDSYSRPDLTKFVEVTK